MRKILLLVEDFNEIVFLDTILKKLGWDVLAQQAEFGLSELLLSFSPDILVITAKGKKLDGLKVSERIKKNNKGFPKIIILKNSKQEFDKDVLKKMGINASLNSPISVNKLLFVLEKMGGMSALEAQKKLSNFRSKKEDEAEGSILAAQNEQELNFKTIVTGSLVEEDEKFIQKSEGLGAKLAELVKMESGSKSRAERFQKALKEFEPPEKDRMSAKAVREQTKKIRQRGKLHKDLDKLDNRRRDFVRALFESAKTSKSD